MHKSLDRSLSRRTAHLHAVQRQPSAQAQPTLPASGLSIERKRIAERMMNVLVAMSPDACEHILRMAEAFASKHPATPRMYLVHACMSVAHSFDTGRRDE
jgi:hypothetical protein